MNDFIKNILKDILPRAVIKFLSYLYQRLFFIRNRYNQIYVFEFLRIKYGHKKALKKIRLKKRIKVVFLLIHDAVWKYEKLYNLMLNDTRYEPLVVVCPYLSHGEEVMKKDMDKAYNAFINSGHNVINAWVGSKNQWLDIKKEIKPDLIFFTNPWPITKPQYLIDNFLDTLTCYVPYGFKNSYLSQAQFNQATQNLVWKFFLETSIHQKLSKQISRNKGANTLVTGFPGMDVFFDKEFIPVDVWKIKDEKIKRIIWAPHHTISGYGAKLNLSTFFNYHEFMFELADKFVGLLQFAFKPHPILRANLSKPEVWGKEKTDAYYKKWEDLENGLLVESGYFDLFFKSDAMIHDCASFVVEYLYTKKPIMFLLHDENVPERFNEIGKKALNEHYHGKNKKDIELFLDEVVLKNNDMKQNDRIRFYEEWLTPPNGITPTENIFNFLNKEFFECGGKNDKQS